MSTPAAYSPATTARMQSLLASLSDDELRALLPGLQAGGGDGLRLLEAELRHRPHLAGLLRQVPHFAHLPNLN